MIKEESSEEEDKEKEKEKEKEKMAEARGIAEGQIPLQALAASEAAHQHKPGGGHDKFREDRVSQKEPSYQDLLKDSSNDDSDVS
jgi:hypothetical protein